MPRKSGGYKQLFTPMPAVVCSGSENCPSATRPKTLLFGTFSGRRQSRFTGGFPTTPSTPRASPGHGTRSPMKIGYARVSTDEQNPDLQFDALRDAGCERIYRDEGVSAVARERPQFEAALAALTPGDTLVIWKMDRAFRSLLNALQVLEARGVESHSLTDAVDTTTPNGRFAYQITNAFAELERALIAERTRAGMEAARRRGTRLGRPPKLTEAQIEKARASIAAGRATITALTGKLGVSPRTLARALGRSG